MKKIIASILLTASASCNLLFAQPINQVAGCRLQALSRGQGTDYRVQVRNTNQVTGCRLQVVGTNQGAEYKVQRTGSKTAELTLEDQIKQGTKTTTNCQLPTANCNNQGDNLDCHLMMNPSSIEEGTKAIGEALGIVGRGEEAAGVSSTSEGRGDVARISSSSLSNQVLRFRDGGPKPKKSKNELAGGLKSIGDSSDEEESDQEDVELKIAAEDNPPTSNSVNDYLKKEIIKVEKVFSQARKAKSVNGWNEAKAAAMEFSNYWNGVIEEIKAGKSTLALSQEEAIFQKEYWIEKAGVTEVKALGAKPCDDDWDAKRNRIDEMMTVIKNKVWPTVSETMKAFIEHPSKMGMHDVRASVSMYASASAYVSALASTSAYAYENASAYVSAYAYAYAYAYAAASASTSAYTSASASAYVHAYVYAYESAHESAYAPAYAYAYESASASAYAYVYAYAYAAASTVSKVFSESSAEAADSGNFFEAVDVSNNVVLDLLKDHPSWFSDAAKENIVWSVQSARDTATFAHAVVAFKKNQEAASVGDRRWKMEDGRWEEVTREREIEQEKLAEIKALAASPCGNAWNAKDERANAIMKMTREKLGSPVSQTMNEFIAHPNEVTLRATGKSSIIAMTADEAEEAVETAEIFAKISADTAAKGREYDFDAADQENLDWSETITREIVEFARAVAIFKAAKQP